MRGLRLGLSLTGGAASFSPASLSPSAWYDPSDLSTLFQDSAGTTPVTADGDPVGKMLDKSGNGNHLTQATAGSRPLYKTSGGLSWLLFDGVDDYLIGGDVLDLGSNGYFASIAVRLSAWDYQGLFAKSVAGSSVGRYGVLKDSGVLTSLYENAAGVQSKTVVFGATTDAVLTAKLGRAGTNRLRVNAVNQGADFAFAGEAAVQNTANAFLLGAYNDATGMAPLAGYYLDGRVYGLLVKLAATPSDAEIAQAETWLGAKAGLVL